MALATNNPGLFTLDPAKPIRREFLFTSTKAFYNRVITSFGSPHSYLANALARPLLHGAGFFLALDAGDKHTSRTYCCSAAIWLRAAVGSLPTFVAGI